MDVEAMSQTFDFIEKTQGAFRAHFGIQYSRFSTFVKKVPIYLSLWNIQNKPIITNIPQALVCIWLYFKFFCISWCGGETKRQAWPTTTSRHCKHVEVKACVIWSLLSWFLDSLMGLLVPFLFFN